MSKVTSLLSVCLVAALLAVGTGAFAKKDKKEKKTEPPPPAKEEIGPPLPDLVILPDETKVEFGGCEKGDPLIKGVVAIRNSGKERAPPLLLSPLTVGYIPENLNIKDEDIDPNSLKPGEILTKEITAGKGEEKNNRGFNTKRKIYVVVDPYDRVAESNETNNLLVREVELKCK
jgi:hypothetical protein